MRLAKLAKIQGRAVEDVAIDLLSEEETTVETDPLDEFIGAFQSDVPDWADDHDKYLGEALYREMRGEDK